MIHVYVLYVQVHILNYSLPLSFHADTFYFYLCLCRHLLLTAVTKLDKPGKDHFCILAMSERLLVLCSINEDDGFSRLVIRLQGNFYCDSCKWPRVNLKRGHSAASVGHSVLILAVFFHEWSFFSTASLLSVQWALFACHVYIMIHINLSPFATPKSWA